MKKGRVLHCRRFYRDPRKEKAQKHSVFSAFFLTTEIDEIVGDAKCSPFSAFP